jgi:hypothetical protein
MLSIAKALFEDLYPTEKCNLKVFFNIFFQTYNAKKVPILALETDLLNFISQSI